MKLIQISVGKDPAVLWYWNDWNGGTITMSRHIKGCYMDLLHAQHNSGHLSLGEIKTVLGSDFGQSWPTLQKKFKTDKDGLYYNERAKEEKEKRSTYSKSRSKNRTYDKHMSLHMEDENEDVNNINNLLLKKGIRFSEKFYNETWSRWLSFKKTQFKFEYKSMESEITAYSELNTLSSGDEIEAEKIINQSITKGWKGLFALKTDEKNGTTTTNKQQSALEKFVSGQ